MTPRLLPLLVGPIILLPLALYAWRRRQVRGARWYSLLLFAVALWGSAYAIELATLDFAHKTIALKVKYIGVTLLPVAWIGFVLDFVASDLSLIGRVTRRMAAAAAMLLAIAWTNDWHGLFWGQMTVLPIGDISLFIGRGPVFFLNVFYTYAALWLGVGILVVQAVRSPYLYRKRAIIIVAATVIPWVGNVAFVSQLEGPANMDLTPYLFACTAVLSAVAVFRYRVLDAIPTLADARIGVIGDGLAITDASGRIADLNPAAELQLNRHRADIAGTPLSDILPGWPAPDGRERRHDVTLPSTRGDRVYDMRLTPIRVHQDRLTGYVVLLTDVTEQRRLEAGLREAQKMEAVGKLAGGIAHDFNNMLTTIIGFATLAEGEAPPGSPTREWLRQIRTSGEQAAVVTRQLLAFGRRQLLQPVVLDLNDTVDEWQAMLRRVVGEHVRIVVELGPAVSPVRADLSQIQQVLINLTVNARDAMPDGGLITIATANAQVAASSDRPAVPAGAYVTLAVRDTGPGIDPEVLSHIFEPFFTTKAFGKGAGLGLSTVYGIVKQSGGDVVVQTAAGEGSTFTVYLPALRAKESLSGTIELTALPMLRGVTALLVEADDGVRRFAEDALTTAGCAVVAVSSPTEALAAAAVESQPLDLLIAELVMPGMGGVSLAERLTAIRPGIRVLFLAGDSEDEASSRAGSESVRAILEKPFTPADLRMRVQQLLQASV